MSYSFKKSLEEIAKRKQKLESAVFTNAEMVTVFWITKEEIVKELLPPPLKPIKEPIVSAFIAIYPETNFGIPYNEAALFLRAEFDGILGNYCLAMHLIGPGADLAMAGGREVFGFPKKTASKIHFNKLDKEFEGWNERHGQRLIKIKAKFTGRPNDPQSVKLLMDAGFFSQNNNSQIVFNFKYFPNPEGTGFDYNPRLIKEETIFKPKEIQVGEAELKLGSTIHDPWGEIEVVKVLGAIYTKGMNSMLKGSVVTEVDPEKFLPYAFLKHDWW